MGDPREIEKKPVGERDGGARGPAAGGEQGQALEQIGVGGGGRRECRGPGRARDAWATGISGWSPSALASAEAAAIRSRLPTRRERRRGALSSLSQMGRHDARVVEG